MASRPIILYGDPILRAKAEPVTKLNYQLVKLIDDMQDTMYANRGVGLAAPQIGASVRIIVVDISGGTEPDKRLVLLNPRIVASSERETAEEGCLSIPEFITTVPRAKSVKVIGETLSGEKLQIETTGLEARGLQHEIDHLNGILIVDRLNPVQRDLFDRKWRRKIAERKKFF